MTDSWTDKRTGTILNFLINCPKEIVFVKSIDASHKSKTIENIFKMRDDIIRG